jgi:alkyldihydroxyacetonephosphate synthase
MADVAETSAVWKNLVPLYHNTIAAAYDQFQRDGMAGYIGCHISHTYKTGACLYFTYATRQPPGRELAHYYTYKNRITETFLESGGTLSHHHAIGIEHLPWMEEEVSAPGLQALRAVKASIDPKGIFNPGKLLADTRPMQLGAPERKARPSARPPEAEL